MGDSTFKAKNWIDFLRPRIKDTSTQETAHFLRDLLKKKVIEKETEVEVNFCLVIFLFHESKINAVLEPKIELFRGLVAFEAKDLSFEAKGFKM